SIDLFKLEPVQPRYLLSCRGDRFVRQGSVGLQIGIGKATAPVGKAGERIGTQLPQCIDAMLQEVGRSALIAFAEGGDVRILLLPQPCISDLNIVLVLGLPDAEIGAVFLVL